MSNLLVIAKRFISDPTWRFRYKCAAGIYNKMPDEEFLKLKFKYCIGKDLNLEKPQTFNEKLQWLKLHDRKPIYTTMVDKVKVRDYISHRIGSQYLIPSIGVWENPDDIDFEKLPNEFVLKCNHNSGTGMCICKDKKTINIKKVKADLKHGLAEDYFYQGREWPYKNVPRKIIGEQFMVDESGDDLKDYKVLCFNGEPKLIELHKGRFTDHQTQDFYTTEWKKTNISQTGVASFQVSQVACPKPSSLDEMLKLSAMLGEGIPHIRVDWYSINGKLYFGELTFFDGSGFDPWDDPKDDLMLGEWIKLPIE